MTAFNSIHLNLTGIDQRSENLTFSQHITFIKTEMERSTINVLEFERQLNNLISYLEKASPEEMREAFKVLNQVKVKVQISGNDWGKNFKDLERKFIQADLINWENIPEVRGEVSEASKRILNIFDFASTVSSFLSNTFC